MSEVIARLDQREKRYASDMNFSYNSAMTFTFDLETWFKVTAHPLLKSSAYGNYEPNRAKWRIYML